MKLYQSWFHAYFSHFWIVLIFSMVVLQNNLFSLSYPHINESFEQYNMSDGLRELSLRVAWAQCWLNCSLSVAVGPAVHDRRRQSGEAFPDSQVVWRQLHHPLVCGLSLSLLQPPPTKKTPPSTNPPALTKVPQSAAQSDPCPCSASSQPSSSW